MPGSRLSVRFSKFFHLGHPDKTSDASESDSVARGQAEPSPVVDTTTNGLPRITTSALASSPVETNPAHMNGAAIPGPPLAPKESAPSSTATANGNGTGPRTTTTDPGPTGTPPVVVHEKSLEDPDRAMTAQSMPPLRYVDAATVSEEMRSSNRLHKRLVLFSDGTWVDGYDTNGRELLTNVLRLARCVFPEDRAKFPPIPQVVYYQSGVGTTDSGLLNVSQGATGAGIIDKIREAYTFIAQNWIPGDEIFLFGFSRGAYTVRTIAALIGDLGVLPRTAMHDWYAVFEAYQNRSNPSKAAECEKFLEPYKRGGALNPKRDEGDWLIQCVGVWDTVGAVGLPGAPKDTEFLGFKDTNLGTHIKHAFQALAINETREDFIPTKWQQTPEGHAKGQELKQVWFSGSHSDVGGGYQGHDLSDITLTWMAANLQQVLSLDIHYLFTIPNPHDAWGALKPHDPRKKGIMALSFPTTRVLPTTMNLTTNELYHPSILNQKPCTACDKIKLTMTSNPELVAELMPLEVGMRDWWSDRDISHSLDEKKGYLSGVLEAGVGIVRSVMEGGGDVEKDYLATATGKLQREKSNTMEVVSKAHQAQANKVQ